MIDNKDLYERFKMNIAISNFKKENSNNPKEKILKIVASFILAIGITGGLAFAAPATIEKIWKEPKTYGLKEAYNHNIPEEEKAKCISEEEATNFAKEYLNKMGFDGENIANSNLYRDYNESENIWSFTCDFASIRIDAENGNLLYVQCPSYAYKIPYNYGIDRVEARKVAKELLEKFNLQEKDAEYELVSLKRNDEPEEDAWIWYADFYKKYGDLLSEYEYISIGWVPTINGIYSYGVGRNKYENNEQVITEEEAVQIVKSKDGEIEKEKQVKNIEAKLRIKKMNENVYLRENFKEEFEKGTLNLEKTGENTYRYKEDSVFYKTEERVRKVWCVVVEYDVEEFDMNAFSYFVDATTGEIIGGQRGDVFFGEDGLRNDPHNVIEK